MKKVILLAGSNSSTSINKKLIHYTASLLNGVEKEIIELEDYEPPMFGVDLESEMGLHSTIKKLKLKLDEADAIIVSTPEHNKMPPAFFKNMLDWLSRYKMHEGGEEYLSGTPVLLLSTSPGRGGANLARAQVKLLLERAEAELVEDFGLPSFNHNFEDGKITNEALDQELRSIIKKFEGAIK